MLGVVQLAVCAYVVLGLRSHHGATSFPSACSLQPRKLRLCEGGGESGVSPDADEARRFLGLGTADSDVEEYLVRGQTLLGKQVVLLVSSEDEALEEVVLLVATKLVKLGASVVVLANDPSQCIGLSSRVPYPRCTVRQTQTEDPDDLTMALGGVVGGASSTVMASGLIATPPTNAEELAALATAVEEVQVQQLVLLSNARADAGAGERAEEQAEEAALLEQWEQTLSGGERGSTDGKDDEGGPAGAGTSGTSTAEECTDGRSPAGEASRRTCVLRMCPLYGGKEPHPNSNPGHPSTNRTKPYETVPSLYPKGLGLPTLL